MRMHEFVSRSLARRLKGKQRGEYEKAKHLIREHGGPSLRAGDRGHTEAVLAHHGISSIPKEDREIGFRGPASIKRRKPAPAAQGGGRTFQRTGFGVDRSFAPAKPAAPAKPKYETALNPARRRAHQARGGPTPHWWSVKHHMPPHKQGFEPGGESSPLAGRKKLNRGLGPAAHPTKGKVAYVHPASVQPHRSSRTPDTGGEQHVHYPGEGNIQPLSKGSGGSRKGGTVPKERVVGIGHRAAEGLRRERSRHGQELHKENLSKYKKDLDRYESRKGTQSGGSGGQSYSVGDIGKRGSGRGPGTGKPSSATKRIWSSQYNRWIDAPVSGEKKDLNPVRHRKEWWEDDYSYPLIGRGATGTYAGGTGMSGFGSPKKPEKPKPLSADMIGTKKGLRKKYKAWKKTGETAFHHPDGTPKSSFQPSDELIRYHTARERGLVSNIHEYGILKNQGKAPRLPHEGGKHPADFNEFSDNQHEFATGDDYPSSGHYSGAEGLSKREADKYWETENIQPQYVKGQSGDLYGLPQSIHTRSRGGRPPHGEGYTRMMGPPNKPTQATRRYAQARIDMHKKKEGAIGVGPFGRGRVGQHGGRPKAIKVGGVRPGNPADIAERKEELHEFAVSVMKPPAKNYYGQPRHQGIHDPNWDSLSTANTHVKHTRPEWTMKTRSYHATDSEPYRSRAKDEAEKGQIELNRTRRGTIYGGGTSKIRQPKYEGDPTWHDAPKLPTKRPRGGPYMHEFYGPTVNLRAFRPGHLEFGGRKTGGRGKKMMMPGHYRFHDRGGPTSTRED